MSSFVLLHGAWHGGWCWQRVAPRLRQAGHDVHTPTLSGLSDRAHVLTPETGLATHIEDVCKLLEYEDLHDVILVGHSYAGQIVTAVADRLGARLADRVYLDAFVGDDGDAAIDLLPTSVAGHYRDSVHTAGFGWLIPPRSLEKLGVTDAADTAWLQARLTPHPWRSYTDRLQLDGRHDDVPATFIECTDWLRVFQPFAEKAARSGWPTLEIATGHEAMVTAPHALADLLLYLANRSRPTAGLSTSSTTPQGR